MRSRVEPLRGATPAKRGMKELVTALASRRHAAFARAKRAVASPRCRSLLLDTLQWVEDGDWVRQSPHSGRQPSHSSPQIYSRRKKLRELDARQRHKLRIAVKKLRYAGDFFGGLFSGHKAKKRLSAYEDSLKELQDHLGALNDIQVHQKMVPELASGKQSTNCRERVFAAGVVSGKKKKIGVLVLGAALAFGTSTGAWAQGGGAGGGAGGAGGGAAGTGAGGNSAGSSVGERGAPNAPSRNLNPSNPNTVPQSNETPVSPGTPGTSSGNSTH